MAGAGGDYTNQRHEAARRRDHALELYDQGLSYTEIGAELGVSRQRATQLIDRAIAERPALAVAAERDFVRKNAQLAAIDKQRRGVEMERETVLEILGRDGRTVVTASGKVIEGVQDDPTTLAAIDRLVRLDELLIKLADQESKLLGLNAKTEVNVSGGVKYELVGVDPGDLA